MKRWLLLLTLGLVYSVNVFAQAGNPFEPSDAHYLWPTNASHHLTSTFAETRLGHFHAALDIKTWGRRGYEIYATRDAVLYRLAIKPTGYGKVLYLKHTDGSFSVYAHLMRFNDRLQHYADSLRFSENHRPYFDRVVEEEQIHIKQGELIALSGASGIGPPHLHFELRSPQQAPFNPLLTNLSVQDNIAPAITNLSVEPLASNSIIEGKKKIHTRRPHRRNGYYDFGTVEISGAAGLGINTYDKSNGVPNPYAVYQLSMSVDGKQLFRSKVDSFSYAETNQMFIDRVYPLLRKYGQGYQRLFVADGNTLNFYTTGPDKGKLGLAPGLHKVSITASDYFGNRSTAVVRLSVKEAVRKPYYRAVNKASPPTKIPKITIDRWNWQPNWVNIAKKDFRELTVAIPDWGRLTAHSNMVTINLRNLDNLFMNIPGMGPTIFRRMIPSTKGLLTSIDKQARVIFPRHAFYDTVSVTLAAKQFAPDSVKAIIGPEAYPLDKEFELRIKRSPALRDTSKLAFYKYNERYNYWYLVETGFSEDYITMQSNTLGTFITRRDTTPPTLDNPRLYRRPDGQWLIYFDADDDLSGIDPDRSLITVNGLKGIAEYEPEDNRLVYYYPEFDPPSAMDIKAV